MVTAALTAAVLALAVLAWRTRTASLRAEHAAREARAHAASLDRALAELMRRLTQTGTLGADPTTYLPRVRATR